MYGPSFKGKSSWTPAPSEAPRQSRLLRMGLLAIFLGAVYGGFQLLPNGNPGLSDDEQEKRLQGLDRGTELSLLDSTLEPFRPYVESWINDSEDRLGYTTVQGGVLVECVIDYQLDRSEDGSFILRHDGPACTPTSAPTG